MPLIGGITIRERPQKYPGQPRYKRLDFVREPDPDYENWRVLRSSFQKPAVLVQETAEVPRIESAPVRRPEVEYLQPLQIQQPPVAYPYSQPVQYQQQYPQQSQPYFQQYPQPNYQQQYQNPPPPPPPPHYQHYSQQQLDYHHPRGAIGWPANQPGIDQYLPPPDDDDDDLMPVRVDPHYVVAKPRPRVPIPVPLGSKKKRSRSRSKHRNSLYSDDDDYRGRRSSYQIVYDSDDSCAHLRVPSRRRLGN